MTDPLEHDPPAGFRIEIENEDELIRHAVREASTNMQKPAEYWLRLNGEIRHAQHPHQWSRTYHVDLFDLTLEVVETWDGKETSRRTDKLDLERYR